MNPRTAIPAAVAPRGNSTAEDFAPLAVAPQSREVSQFGSTDFTPAQLGDSQGGDLAAAAAFAKQNQAEFDEATRLRVLEELGHKCAECLVDAHLAKLLELLEDYKLPPQLVEKLKELRRSAEHREAIESHLSSLVAKVGELVGMEMPENLDREAVADLLEQADLPQQVVEKLEQELDKLERVDAEMSALRNGIDNLDFDFAGQQELREELASHARLLGWDDLARDVEMVDAAIVEAVPVIEQAPVEISEPEVEDLEVADVDGLWREDTPDQAAAWEYAPVAEPKLEADGPDLDEPELSAQEAEPRPSEPELESEELELEPKDELDEPELEADEPQLEEPKLEVEELEPEEPELDVEKPELEEPEAVLEAAEPDLEVEAPELEAQDVEHEVDEPELESEELELEPKDELDEPEPELAPEPDLEVAKPELDEPELEEPDAEPELEVTELEAEEPKLELEELELEVEEPALELEAEAPELEKQEPEPVGLEVVSEPEPELAPQAGLETEEALAPDPVVIEEYRKQIQPFATAVVGAVLVTPPEPAPHFQPPRPQMVRITDSLQIPAQTPSQSLDKQAFRRPPITRVPTSDEERKAAVAKLRAIANMAQDRRMVTYALSDDDLERMRNRGMPTLADLSERNRRKQQLAPATRVTKGPALVLPSKQTPVSVSSSNKSTIAPRSGCASCGGNRGCCSGASIGTGLGMTSTKSAVQNLVDQFNAARDSASGPSFGPSFSPTGGSFS